MTAPRGIRNNNPGNIRYVEGITSLYEGCIGSDGSFCVFDTAHHGIRALCKLLLVYQDRHGLRTVRGCINRWAPPVENDTGAYVAAVARALNVEPDDEIDLHRDFVLAGMALAIIQHENGQQPYAPGDVMGAAREALGFAYVDPPIVELPPDTQAPAPIEERPQPAPEQPEKPMPIPLIVGVIGSLLSQLIPVVAPLFDKKTETPAKLDAASRVLDLVVKTTGSLNEQESIAKLQASPDLVRTVTQAIVSDPVIMPMLEISSAGVEKAREDNVKLVQSADVWWKLVLNPVLIVTVMTLPLVYIIVWRITDYLAKVSGDVIAQTIGTVIGLVLGGVMGFWMGQTYQNMKAERSRATDAQPAAAK
jgi:hypothetical protein